MSMITVNNVNNNNVIITNFSLFRIWIYNGPCPKGEITNTYLSVHSGQILSYLLLRKIYINKHLYINTFHWKNKTQLSHSETKMNRDLASLAPRFPDVAVGDSGTVPAWMALALSWPLSAFPLSQMSNLVASQIMNYADVTSRANTIEKWVAVADICRCLHNYNGVLEITSALNRSAIYRLKKTWAKVSKQVSAGGRHLPPPGEESLGDQRQDKYYWLGNN